LHKIFCQGNYGVSQPWYKQEKAVLNSCLPTCIICGHILYVWIKGSEWTSNNLQIYSKIQINNRQHEANQDDAFKQFFQYQQRK